MSHHDRDVEIAAFLRNKGVTRCPTACVVPTQSSPSLADQAALAEYAVARELLRTKAQLDGKFSALCGFGIKPGYRSCQRDLGILGNHPAVQNMLLAARPLGLGTTLTTLHLQFEKEAEAALGLPPNVHSYALLPIGYPMGRFGPVRRIALADVVYEDRWGQPYGD